VASAKRERERPERRRHLRRYRGVGCLRHTRPRPAQRDEKAAIEEAPLAWYTVSSHTSYLWTSFRKSTPPQNRRLIVSITN